MMQHGTAHGSDARMKMQYGFATQTASQNCNKEMAACVLKENPSQV
jgi:hypothetical protein